MTTKSTKKTQMTLEQARKERGKSSLSRLLVEQNKERSKKIALSDQYS